MTEKIQKYQIIKFDFFDSFDFERRFLQKDRQTFGLIEATSRRLKMMQSNMQ